MGIRDWFKKSKPAKEESAETRQPSESDLKNARHADKVCSYCGNTGADRKWAGKYWHKSCLRAAKKEAKGYIR